MLFFEDRVKTANAVMTDIYTRRDNGLFTGLFTAGLSVLGLYSDELTSYYNPGSLSFNFIVMLCKHRNGNSTIGTVVIAKFILNA
jgi:hypothetical protein